ncbi:BlaI/MecI/CopY family transcriptional regulator [bacterium]|nr:BlaI/MecI/CopY family transcriptional regulator [bacterium]
MNLSLPRIADSEWRIMKILWKRSPLSAQDIIQGLGDEVDWTDKTVKTLLNRLVNKGALGYEKDGRSYLYFPRVEESVCKRQEARSFVNRVFDGALKPMLAAFLEDGNLSSEEIRELQKILEKGER